MKEILFRGKRIDNGEWIEGYYAVQSNHACFAHELKYTHFIFKDICLDFNLGGLQEFEVIPETVGQYTRLKDKNGKQIFEGDIVQYYGTYPLEVYIEEGHTKIRWYDTISASKYDELFFTIDREGYGEWEIIGNIHDNPELLKGGAV